MNHDLRPDLETGLRQLGLDVALAEPLLASTHGGEVLIRERKGQRVPEHALYRVVLKVRDAEAAAAVGRVQRGQVVIDGTPKTLLGDVFRSALAVLIRDSGW